MDECLSVVHLLRHAACQAEKEIRSALKDTELSFAQAMLMLHLDEGITSVSDLSEELCCSCGNVSQLIDSLTSKGLVDREQCKDDRRVMHLILTKNGRSTVSSLRKRMEKQAHTCFDDLPTKDRRSLQVLLERYVALEK